jgi:hypothetical protein
LIRKLTPRKKLGLAVTGILMMLVSFARPASASLVAFLSCGSQGQLSIDYYDSNTGAYAGTITSSSGHWMCS